jgi:hypothetical protein
LYLSEGAVLLHCFAGECTIRIAYQAAEANHPDKGREGLPLKETLCQQSPAIPAERQGYLEKATPQETPADQITENAATGFGGEMV